MENAKTTPGAKRKLFEKRTDAVKLFLPTLAFLFMRVMYEVLPNVSPSADYEPELYPAFLLYAAGVFFAISLISIPIGPIRRRLVKYSYIIAAFCLLIGVYDLLTTKSGIITVPLWPNPDKVLVYYTNHYKEFIQEIVVSLSMLGNGLLWGVVLGLFSGTLSGISRVSNYWIAPLLRIIGPIPPLVMLPVTFAIFPEGKMSATVLIMWAMWFPLTLKLTAAIKNLPPDVIECARVLGANRLRVVLHVIVPLVLPAVFQGLFMGMSSAFGTMGAVEALGTSGNGGLIYDLNYNSDLAKYYAVYAVFPILVVLFSLIMRILNAVRDYFLRWQKGYKR